MNAARIICDHGGRAIQRVDSETLKGVTLRHTRLYEADLRGEDLRDADLRGSTLHYANLVGANLSKADLRTTRFSGAALRKANLSYANLKHAYFDRAHMAFAKLCGATIEHTNLSHACLQEADLRSASLRWSDLSHADLRGANLRYACLDYATVYNALFERAYLPWASHTVLAEILRQEASDCVEKRAFAGLVLVSRGWCWDKWTRVAREYPNRAVVAWAASVLDRYAEKDPECPKELLSLINTYKREA